MFTKTQSAFLHSESIHREQRRFYIGEVFARGKGAFYIGKVFKRKKAGFTMGQLTQRLGIILDSHTERLQAYLAAPTEAEGEAIKTLAAQKEKRLLKDITSRLESLKAAGMEQALFYNRLKEEERFYRAKEITEEEYKNNPLKKAYEDYAEAIPYKARDLSEPCLMKVIVTTPDYKSAIDKAIKRAEKLIKDIQKATGCNAETMAFIVSDLIPDICETGYVLYHPQEVEQQTAARQKKLDEIKDFTQQVNEPLEDEAFNAYQAHIEELFFALQQETKEYASRIYKASKARSITEQILSRIFPEQKIAIRRDIAERHSLVDGYTHLPNNAIHQLVKQTLNNPQNVSALRKGTISIQPNLLTKDISITYNANDGTIATIELSRTKELFKERVRGGAKLYNFFLSKINEQSGAEITTFSLQDLVDSGLYANKDSAYKGVKKITDKMMSMSIEGTQTIYEGKKKKQIRNTKAVILSQRVLSYNFCSVSLPPIIRSNTKFITILPVWAYSLTENGYLLLDYIYYLARQNAKSIRDNHAFNISMEAVRTHLGLPTPDKAGANPGRLIIEPIEAAVVDIEDKNQGEIMITPTYSGGDYNNVHEFLNGYLQVQLEEKAEAYMIEIEKRREKKLKSAGKNARLTAPKEQEKNEQTSK